MLKNITILFALNDIWFMTHYLNIFFKKSNDFLLTIFNESETKLFLFYKLIEVLGFIIFILSLKSFIINRKIDIDEEYDEAGNF